MVVRGVDIAGHASSLFFGVLGMRTLLRRLEDRAAQQIAISSMTFEDTKAELVRLLTDESNKVVSLSGPWGTGKTHLWNEIRGTSNVPQIQSALYVSLFGVKDINQLKLKVVQSALPIGSESNTVTEGLTKAYRTTLDVLKKVHPAWGAMDQLALIAVPAALSGRFVVIDDIERKHSALSVDEVLGFVDEYTQRFGTRMLLILNSEKLSGEGDALWTTFREKVVDDELRFCPTPLEAFDIAVPEGSTPFREAVRQAVEACGLTNIRIIKKVARVVDRLLGSRRDLPIAVQARTIPSIVLLTAIHHNAIKDGPDFDFVANFNRGGGEWLDRYLAGKHEEEVAPEIAKPPAAWTLLMSKLRISSVDDFEELVVAYLKEGKHDVGEISKVIDGYCSNADQMKSAAIANRFVEHFNWYPRLSNDELLIEAEAVAARAGDLDAFFVTSLYGQMADLEGGSLVADRMVDEWVRNFRSRSSSFKFDGFPFGRPLLSRIKEAIEAMRDSRHEFGSLDEVVARLATQDGWGHREEAVMKRSTVEEYLKVIRTLDGKELKFFLLKNLDILERGEEYDRSFGEARLHFLEACRSICITEPKSRLSRVLRVLFSESKVPTLLDAPAPAVSVT